MDLGVYCLGLGFASRQISERFIYSFCELPLLGLKPCQSGRVVPKELHSSTLAEDSRLKP